MELNELTNNLQGKSIEESFKNLVSLFPGKVMFTTSFGIEDQVITHIIFENNIPIEVITLDTGRLFPETYKVFAETINKYNKKINVYFPGKSCHRKDAHRKRSLQLLLFKGGQTGVLQDQKTCTS